MEKVRLKAREYLYGYIDLYYMNGRDCKQLCMDSFARNFPSVAKQIKAADGKCVDIQISMEIVK